MDFEGCHVNNKGPESTHFGRFSSVVKRRCYDVLFSIKLNKIRRPRREYTIIRRPRGVATSLQRDKATDVITTFQTTRFYDHLAT